MSFKTRQLCLLTTALVTIPAAAFMTTPAYADCVSGANNTVLCSGSNDTNGFIGGDGLTLTTDGVAVSNPTGNAVDLGLNSVIYNGSAVGPTTGNIEITTGPGVAINASSLTMNNLAGSTVSSNSGLAIQINSVGGNVSTINNYGTITASGSFPSFAVSDGNGDITITNHTGGVITGSLDLNSGHNVVILEGGSTLNGVIYTTGSNNQLVLAGSGDGTMNGVINGFQTLTKNGTGTWTEIWPTNFSGGIAIIQGTLSGAPSVLNAGGLGTPNNIDVQAGGTVNFSSAAGGTFAGVISGAGTVTVTGPNVTLTGANSYTGGTAITSGALTATNVGATSALTLPGNVTDNATLGFDIANGGTFSGVISGTGIVQKTGFGTLVFSNLNTYSGDTYLFGGKLSISNPSNLGSSSNIVFVGGELQIVGASSFTLTQNTTGSSTAIFDIAGAGTITESGVISSYTGQLPGTAGLAKNGPGALVLTGVNTYVDATTINAGILSISAANNLGASSGIVFGGGELDTTGVGFTITKNMSGTANTNLSANINTVGGGNTITASGVISNPAGGTVSLTKTGLGTLVLTGANTYTSGTTITAGTLEVTNVGATTALALPGNVTDNANLDFIVANGGTSAGIISGTGNIVKDGAGTLVLSSVNTYTGTTTINAGELSVVAAANLGASSGIVFGGGTLQTTATLTLAQGMSGTSAANIEVTTGTTTVSGIISTTGLTKKGAGSLVLSGINTYTGPTTIYWGTLSINAANNLGTSQTILFGAGTLETTGAGFTLTQEITGVNADFNITTTGAGNTTTASGILDGNSYHLMKYGLGTLVLTGGSANTFSGDLDIMQGTLELTNVGTTTELALENNWAFLPNNNTTLDFNTANGGTFTGNIFGVGNVVKDGVGTLTLTGAGTYTGTTTINSGELSISSAATLGASSSIVFGGGALQTTGTGFTVTQSMSGASAAIIDTADAGNTSTASGVIGTVGLIKDGLGTLVLSGVNTYTGVTTINAGILSVSAVNNLGSSAGINFGGGTLQTTGTGFTLTQNMSGTGDANIDVSGAANTTTLIGEISTANLTKSGAGTLVLSGVNTFSTLDIKAGQVNSAGTGMTPTAAIIIGGGGTLSLSGDMTIGSLSGSGGTIAMGTNTLSVAGANSSPTTYAGVITGTGGLTKTGTGKLVLSGVNTYTGATTVSVGELEVALGGSLTSAATVAAGADLRVNGTVIGAVVNNGTLNGSGTIIGNITNNATYSPGNSPGIVTVTGNYTQAANSTLAVDIHAGATPATPVAGTDYDQVNVSGTAILAGTIAATVQPGHYVPGATYNLMTAGLGFGGTNFTTVTGLPTQGFISFTPSIVNGAGAAQTYVWTVSRLAYATAATTPNQIATANAFQSAIAGGVANPASDMASVLFALDGSTRAQAAALFTSANPAYYGSVATANQDLGATFLRNVTARAHDLKGGGWATGYYHWGKGGGNDNAAGANIHNDGVAGGIDYTVATNVLAGIAVGYGHSSIDGRDNLASGNSKGWQAGLYLAFNAAGFDLTGAVAYQKTNADGSRMITGPVGFNRIATGHPDGKNYLASLEGSYKASMENMNLRPFVGAIYNKAKIDGFSESGANALDLNIQGFDASSTRLYGGIEIKGNIASGSSTTISPYARASYSHELSGNHRDIWSSFAGGGSSFMVTGREVSEGQVDLAFGIEANVASNVTLFVGYDGQLRSDQKYHGVSGGFRVSF